MSEREVPKSAERIPRVALRPETETIIEGWREHLQAVCPSFTATNTDLVTWAVERASNLSNKDIQQIRHRFFDEVKELEDLVGKLKSARASGDEQTVSLLMKRVSLSKAKSGLKNLEDNGEPR